MKTARKVAIRKEKPSTNVEPLKRKMDDPSPESGKKPKLSEVVVSLALFGRMLKKAEEKELKPPEVVSETVDFGDEMSLEDAEPDPIEPPCPQKLVPAKQIPVEPVQSVPVDPPKVIEPSKTAQSIETNSDRNLVLPATEKVAVFPIEKESRSKPIIPSPFVPAELWTEKHTPKSLREVVGNAHLITKVVNWLQHWSPKSQYKATLISGPPGIGKTTTVRLVAKGVGYAAQELNASDLRNKESVEKRLFSACDNNGIAEFGKCAKGLVIMDEIDGMCGGDKGGISALIEVIKRTKIPIICICNERGCPKLKSLAKHCMDIRFQKPSTQDIVRRLEQIAKSEGIDMKKAVLNVIAQCSGLDLRQAVNTMQLHFRGYSMGQVVSSQKDKCVLLNKFQAVSTLFSNGEAKHEEKMNLFFVDFDFVPLLVHENYLSTLDSLDDLSFAADSIAFADTIITNIKERNDWTLLPVFGHTAAVAPTSYAKIPLENVQFTEILGRGSSERKAQRLRYEIRDAIGPLAHLSEQEAVEDYLDLLTLKVVSALTLRQKDAVPEVLELMETYQLTMELMKNNCLELCSHAIKTEFQALPQTLRSALTKAYTKRHKVMAVEKEETGKTRDSDSEEEEEDANMI